jgi:hypothetical protein
MYIFDCILSDVYLLCHIVSFEFYGQHINAYNLKRTHTLVQKHTVYKERTLNLLKPTGHVLHQQV